ncbi:MAG TPA: septum formation protein Maf [Clostridiales bacterium]|nr:septum formation protein Maf [Clostridiales bacterium]
MKPLVDIKKKIVLASASPRRKELLARMGFSFDVFPSTSEESNKEIFALSAAEQVCMLAEQKAEDTASRIFQDCLVIGADTIVVRDGQILGKPKDRKEAAAMLRSLQGCWHEVLTGIALIDRKLSYRDKAFECTRVEMMQLDTYQIEWYLDSGEYADKAGAYGIQGLAAAFIPRIDGCYFNVMGLPLNLLYKMLQRYKTYAGYYSTVID